MPDEEKKPEALKPYRLGGQKVTDPIDWSKPVSEEERKALAKNNHIVEPSPDTAYEPRTAGHSVNPDTPPASAVAKATSGWSRSYSEPLAEARAPAIQAMPIEAPRAQFKLRK